MPEGPNNSEKRLLLLQPVDSVAIALSAFRRGEITEIDSKVIELKDAIPAGHKCAVKAVETGSFVYKYGAPIGIATKAISIGDHVHSHNVKTALDGIESYTYQKIPASLIDKSVDSHRAFLGYRRTDGKVGTRNEIWVLSTVGCVSRLAQKIAFKANDKYSSVCDGVFAFTHPFGCSQTGGDLDATKNMLAALAQHPNAGGVLILGLGCENNQGRALLESIPQQYHSKLRFFNCQSSSDEIEEGLIHVHDLVEQISKIEREPCYLSDINLGVKCGGSDGFSGLSANPLVGRVADRVSGQGGTVLLTEVPEIFGAETILMNRAIDQEVFEKTVSLIDNFKQYFIDHEQKIHDNPSPGNKDGGITTLEEKSMGAIQKGGVTEVTAVLDYAEPSKQKGLNLLEAPGNDAVSSTALTASGANLILFTTGRGTPLGFPAPTIKISSNSTLAKSKQNWIDFDAGQLLSGTTMSDLSDELLDYIIEVASGLQTSSETNDQREIAIWKNGVTL